LRPKANLGKRKVQFSGPALKKWAETWAGLALTAEAWLLRAAPATFNRMALGVAAEGTCRLNQGGAFSFVTLAADYTAHSHKVINIFYFWSLHSGRNC
jgi:hypothetical protein